MPRMGPGTVEQIGVAVLAAAKTVDTRLVKRRLTTFAGTHRDYMDAQRQVERVQGQLQAARVHLARRVAAQAVAVDGLARALVADRHPRANPFKALDTAAPAALMRLAQAQKVRAIRSLVATVQCCTGLSATTLQAARVADKAARAVEAALASLDTRQNALRKTRRRRDSIGATWKIALAALKRGARAAADDGAPRLHPTLFGRLGTGARKRRKSKSAPTAPTTTTAPA